MSRIEHAQGNKKLVRVNVPPLPVELAWLKLSIFAKKVWYYDSPFMYATVVSLSMPIDKQGMK